jgi:hypothetical protein
LAITRPLNLSEIHIQELVKTVSETIPRGGIYFQMDTKFLQGTFNYAWGMKEHADHRVYPWLGAELNLLLGSMTLEVGAGVAWWKCKAQVYAAFTMTLHIGASFFKDSPDWDWGVDVPVTRLYEISIGGRLQVGGAVKGELVGSTGITGTITGHFSTRRGFELSGSVGWTGVKVKFTGSVLWGLAEKTKEWVLSEPVTWGEFRMPTKPNEDFGPGPAPVSSTGVPQWKPPARMTRKTLRGLVEETFFKDGFWDTKFEFKVYKQDESKWSKEDIIGKVCDFICDGPSEAARKAGANYTWSGRPADNTDFVRADLLQHPASVRALVEELFGYYRQHGTLEEVKSYEVLPYPRSRLLAEVFHIQDYMFDDYKAVKPIIEKYVNCVQEYALDMEKLAAT